MPNLSWTEVRDRAIAFSRVWAESASEHADKQTFWNEFFAVFGRERRTVASFEVAVKSIHGSYNYIDLLWRGVLLVEHKTRGKSLAVAESQGFAYIEDLAREGRFEEIPRFVIVSDFARIALYDLEPDDQGDLPLVAGRPYTVTNFGLNEFHRYIRKFAFLKGERTVRIREEDPAMILHRYFSSHAFETLKEAKLKTARISDFNDPFEFLYVPVGKLSVVEMKNFIGSRDSNVLLQICNQLLEKKMPGLGLTEQDFETFLKQPKTIEKIAGQWPAVVTNNELSYERRRQIVDHGLRAICFSDSTNVKPLDDILLWSHYANKHKGVRIGFEFPSFQSEAFEIEQMRYEEKRPEVVFSLGADANQEAYNALLASAKVKSNAWKYENEYRLFTQTRACERRKITNGDGTQVEEYFLEIKREWFRSVDFGALCPEVEIKKITSTMESDYPASMVCQRAIFHRTDYALEYVLVARQSGK